MNYFKRTISTLLAILMVLTALPMSAFADDPTYISEVRLVGDVPLPEYADPHYYLDCAFTVEGDLPISASVQSSDWYRWVDDGWNDTVEDGEYFVEGTYCYDVKVDLNDQENYFWDTNTKLYINDVECPEFNPDGWNLSPSFELVYVAGKELVVGFNGQIGITYTNLPLSQSNDTISVVGGTKPYTIQKVSGPEWLTVSDAGVISGTPTVVGSNEELVVKVADNVGAEKTINISVQNTYLDPAERQVVSRVVGTVTIPALRCGDIAESIQGIPTETTEGAPAYLSTGSSDIYNSSMDVIDRTQPLEAGEYYMDVCVYVDGEAGHTHMLAKEGMEVIINGENTSLAYDPIVYNDNSYVWVKIGGVVVEHWFDNDTDATCNGCSFTREGCDHQYDNDCDADCNACGDIRAIEHKYDNACDPDCNVCSTPREVPDHVWDDCYDHYCNECNLYRAGGHVYDDCLDAVCNFCSNNRTPPSHTYTDATDTICDNCNNSRTLNYIQAGQTKTVSITTAYEYVDFLFTPAVTKSYRFYSAGELDTYGYIFDNTYNQLIGNDDGGENRNFNAVLELTAGTTYVLRAKLYVNGTGSFTVSLDCNEHTYDNDCDTVCNDCSFTRTVPHMYDNDCDTECNLCSTPREVPDHVYTNDCDKTCNVCNAPRVAPHSWDNDCDTDCNLCSTPRVAPHSPKADGYCSICGQLAEVKINKTYTITLTIEKAVSFIPTVSGKYVIISDNGGNNKEIDPAVSVRDVAEGEEIASSDYYLDNNFYCVFEATAGKTYSINLMEYNGIERTYDFIIYPYAEIAHQPTANEPYVSLTKDVNATYQWYTAVPGRTEVTDLYAVGRKNDVGEASTYTPGLGWKGVEWEDYGEYNAFGIELKAGQTIEMVAGKDLEYLEIWEFVHEYVSWEDVAAGEIITYTAPVDGIYSVYFEANSGQEIYLNAYINDHILTPIAGQTKPTIHQLGTLRCVVTLPDGRKILSNVFTENEVVHTGGTATCKAKAKCTVCGESYGSLKAHKYTNACDPDCNECGATRTPAAHKGGTATCKVKAKCSVCGQSYGSLASHKYGSYVYNNDATSTKDGTKSRTCAVCGVKDTVTAAGTKIKNPFADVKAGEYYTEPVLWAVSKGITNGTSATTFSPDANCTRGQIVTFLWRAAGSPEPNSTKNPFVDVKSDAYYYKAVLWAVEKGITNGMDATHFAPDATCTRGQVVTFLYRAKGKPAASGKNTFTDVKKGEYYYDAVLWAVENNITNGMDATHFAPDATCTRGQIVTFLYRAYKR